MQKLQIGTKCPELQDKQITFVFLKTGRNIFSLFSAISTARQHAKHKQFTHQPRGVFIMIAPAFTVLYKQIQKLADVSPDQMVFSWICDI